MSVVTLALYEPTNFELGPILLDVWGAGGTWGARVASHVALNT
jgi:hypothetical protein